MSLLGTPGRYGSVARFIHWSTAILVVFGYILGEGGPDSEVYAQDNLTRLSLHETAGVLILALLVSRLLWRAVDRQPAGVEMPGWMSLSSRAVHWLLYALLLALPVTGSFGAFFDGHAINILGFGSLGPLTGEDREFGEALLEIHEVLGSAILWVAGIHAAAALYHHYVLRDRVLVAMLPFAGDRDRS